MNDNPKVLQLVRALHVGGLERVVVDLVNGLQERGMECHVGCIVEPGEWAGKANAAGIWTGGVGRRGRIAAVLSLASYLRKHGIGLIHSHNAQAHIFGVAASLLTGIPLVHTKHGRNFPEIPRWVWLSRQLSRFTKRIVAVSDGVRQIAVDVERVPAAKVSVIVNGVDTERFKPGGERGKGQGASGKGQEARGKRQEASDREVTENDEYRISNIQCPSGEGEERTTDDRRQLALRSSESEAGTTDYSLPFEAQRAKLGRQTGVSGGNYDVRPAEVEAAYTEKAVRNVLGVKYPEATGASQTPGRAGCTVERFMEKLQPGTFVVGTVGRIVPEKNYPLLVQAFAEFHSKAPNSHLLIVGDGPNAADVEKTIEEQKIGDACTITGMQEDVLPWFRLMDVFCLSSWTEGTSVTLLEACACGLPAVVTNVGSNARIVRDKQSGFVVASGDKDGLTSALERLAGDLALRIRFGAEARKLAVEEYSADSMVEGYLAVYEEATKVMPQ